MPGRAAAACIEAGVLPAADLVRSPRRRRRLEVIEIRVWPRIGLDLRRVEIQRRNALAEGRTFQGDEIAVFISPEKEGHPAREAAHVGPGVADKGPRPQAMRWVGLDCKESVEIRSSISS